MEPDERQFADGVAVITGAASGIGAGLARRAGALGMTVIAADTDEEAVLLASSLDQSFVALRYGNPGKLRPPVPGYRDSLPPDQRAGLEFMRQASAIGGPAKVREDVLRFVERTQADEVIVAGQIWDPQARQRSLQLTMEAMREPLPA